MDWMDLVAVLPRQASLRPSILRDPRASAKMAALGPLEAGNEIFANSAGLKLSACF
jgi:hypothetical protein